MSTTPIQNLLRALDDELTRDPKGTLVASLLEAYARDHADWDSYAHFHEDRYARNLVRSSELYELMVICWQAGQASPIHDHQGQRCWMAVLEGDMQETLFDSPEVEGAAPVERSSRSFGPGGVTYISDEIALHEIRSSEKKRGITLHLYAQPIRQCRIFDPVTGAVEQRTLRFDTVDGVLQTS